MCTIDTSSKAADAALASYQWGGGVSVVGTSGWEHDSGSAEVHCKVFVSTDEQVGDEDSICRRQRLRGRASHGIGRQQIFSAGTCWRFTNGDRRMADNSMPADEAGADGGCEQGVLERFKIRLPFTPEQVNYLELLTRGICGALSHDDFSRLAHNMPAAAFLGVDLEELGCELHIGAADHQLRETLAGDMRHVEFRPATPDLAFDTFVLVRELDTGEAFISGECCQHGSLEQILSVVLARFDLEYSVIIPFALLGRDECGQEVFGGGVMVASSKGASCVDGEMAGVIGSLLAHAPLEGCVERLVARHLIDTLLAGASGERAETLLGALQAELVSASSAFHRGE